MATLEKIRKRSTLLLIIVGLALLAFIIGDFFTSGRTLFGTGTTIAKVGDEKIDIQEFSRRYEEANQRVQQQNNASHIDPAMIQAEVLNGMVQERLINQEIEALGIEVTNDELSKAMLGANAHPYMYQLARQKSTTSPSTPQSTTYRQRPPNRLKPCGSSRKSRCSSFLRCRSSRICLPALS